MRTILCPWCKRDFVVHVSTSDLQQYEIGARSGHRLHYETTCPRCAAIVNHDLGDPGYMPGVILGLLVRAGDPAQQDAGTRGDSDGAKALAIFAGILLGAAGLAYFMSKEK